MREKKSWDNLHYPSQLEDAPQQKSGEDCPAEKPNETNRFSCDFTE